MEEHKELDILLDFAKIELDLVKHLEVQRERFTSLLIVVSGLVAASVGWDRKISADDALQGAFLIGIGSIGVVQSIKFYTKMMRHYYRYRSFRRYISNRIVSFDMMKLKDEGEKDYEKDNAYPRIYAMKTHRIWVMIPAFVSILGVAFVVTALLSS